MADLPVIITQSGPQPTPPASIRAALVAKVAATNPGYTANLPGSLIEDVASTDVGAIAEIDSARVETLDGLSPYGANEFLISQLGQIYIGQGSAPAVPTNVSVFVTFFGPPGFVIAKGFTVSDGTYQYVVQDGGIIAADGSSDQLFCLATIAGQWAVPTGTVTQLVTSVPTTSPAITCSNEQPGIPSAVAETEAQYRARVLQAGQAVATGTTQLLKTLLGKVSGVQQRLVSVRQQGNSGWEVIVGGGDPYEVAYAIFDSGLNINVLTGSVLSVTNITQAANGVVTTDLNHGYSIGQDCEMSEIVGMTPLNGVPVTVTAVPSEKQFAINVDTTGYPAYVSGGVVSPNLRNQNPSISDYPDVYAIPFVSPPQQTVTIAVSWNTTAPNFVSAASIAQLAAPAIADYVNSIPVGAPMNLLLLQQAFVASIASVLSADQVSVLTFAVSINGISTPPSAGTELIFGDPESYFETSSAAISVVQS